MKIEVNLTKARFHILIALIAVAVTIAAAFAYNSNFNQGATQAATIGHSADEVVVRMADATSITAQDLLMGIPMCTSNQVLTKTVSGWNCVTAGAGGGSITGGGGNLLATEVVYKPKTASSITIPKPTDADYALLRMYGGSEFPIGNLWQKDGYEYMNIYVDFTTSRSTGMHVLIKTVGEPFNNYNWKDQPLGTQVSKNDGYADLQLVNILSEPSSITITGLPSTTWSQGWFVEYYKKGASVTGSSGNTWKDVSVVYYGETCRINGDDGPCNQNGATTYFDRTARTTTVTVPISGECAGARELLFKYYTMNQQSSNPSIVEVIPIRGNKGIGAQYTNPGIIEWQKGRVLLGPVGQDAVGQTRGTFKIDVEDTVSAVYLQVNQQDNMLFGLELDACR